MVCRLFKGSRALVWTLFTIALFSKSYKDKKLYNTKKYFSIKIK
jgi:hypothetical protein